MLPLLDVDELAFVEEVRAFCEMAASTLSPTQYYSGRGGLTRELYKQLGQRGWLSLTWPSFHGGQERAITYDFLLWNELAYWRLARPDLGPGIVAKILIETGTAEQKDRFLPEIASGEHGYALGYSEPEAGSDLASLRTRAVKSASGYVVNGEKCWTSDAHNSTYIWLLARTGTSESRARGLTIFICPTATPGITINPIATMDGHRLNQVVFDDVLLSDDLRIGPENGAWGMIRAALTTERHLQLLPGRPRRDFEDLVAACEAASLLDDPVVTAKLLPLLEQVLQVEAGACATIRELLGERSGSVAASMTRLIGSRLAQAIPRAALELLGPAALSSDSIFELLWRESIMETIAGGSSEMLESIIATQSLHLTAAR